MTSKLKSFGLVSAHISRQIKNARPVFNNETRSLISAAENYFQSVILIDPADVGIQLEEGAPIKVFHRQDDISRLSTLMVRGTKGIEIPTKVVVHALNACGCHIVDPITRFSGERASKMLTSIHRHLNNTGSTSYLAFNQKSALRILRRASHHNQFPLLCKPVYGKHGHDIRVFTDLVSVEAWAEEFYKKKQNKNTPLLFQKFETFIHEYRALVIHGYCIGIVKKIKQPGEVAANTRYGSQFVPYKDNALEAFISENVSSQGLLGVDIGSTAAGEFVIIEANRAPEWSVFQRATDLNVAEVIMEKVYGYASRYEI